MIKWLPLICLVLMAFTPVYDTHDTPAKLDVEFKAVSDTAQPRQWRVFGTTPVLSDLDDGEFVTVSSNSFNAIMWRANQEIFSVKGSCVTAYR